MIPNNTKVLKSRENKKKRKKKTIKANLKTIKWQ